MVRRETKLEKPKCVRACWFGENNSEKLNVIENNWTKFKKLVISLSSKSWGSVLTHTVTDQEYEDGRTSQPNVISNISFQSHGYLSAAITASTLLGILLLEPSCKNLLPFIGVSEVQHLCWVRRSGSFQFIPKVLYVVEALCGTVKLFPNRTTFLKSWLCAQGHGETRDPPIWSVQGWLFRLIHY